jgi:hypothetical protein
MHGRNIGADCLRVNPQWRGIRHAGALQQTRPSSPRPKPPELIGRRPTAALAGPNFDITVELPLLRHKGWFPDQCLCGLHGQFG